MKVTFPIMIEKYQEYNRLYFDGGLPMPNFGMLETYSYLGRFRCAKIVGNRRLKRQMIELSCYYDFTEEELRDVFVHEMIHYYLAYHHIDNNLTHGEAFLKMCQEMNLRYGMNLKARAGRFEYKRAADAPLGSWIVYVIMNCLIFW